VLHTNPELKDCLSRKVSIERIGIEMDLMMQGINATSALHYLIEFDILDLLL